MIVYEVNLSVEAGVADAYREWLGAHVDAMLALPGFVDARRYEVVDPAGADRVGLCVHYRLRDRQALQAYLDEHAERMRGEAQARFAGRFEASRRVLRPIAD
jgi:quinol monooxygenase YgiN